MKKKLVFPNLFWWGLLLADLRQKVNMEKYMKM
ncbi:Uncharacterised protein [Streptococcus pneumoniae]|nr:Uncharacterised protein [Streptococcus pneumoniae]